MVSFFSMNSRDSRQYLLLDVVRVFLNKPAEFSNVFHFRIPCPSHIWGWEVFKRCHIPPDSWGTSSQERLVQNPVEITVEAAWTRNQKGIDFPFSWEFQKIPTDELFHIFQRGRAQPHYTNNQYTGIQWLKSRDFWISPTRFFFFFGGNRTW